MTFPFPTLHPLKGTSRVFENATPSSRFQNVRHVAGDGLLEIPRLSVEGFQFSVQCFELFLKILIAHGLPGSHPYVATWVERPPLCLDLLDRGRLAQAEHVSVNFGFLPKISWIFACASLPPSVKSRCSPR